MPDPTYSVTHLLNGFRSALCALAPIAESVGVTWKDVEAYDEWDALTESLFDVLVVSAVSGDLETASQYRPVARFGFGLPLPGVLTDSWIEVDVPERAGTYAFIAFSSTDGFGLIVVTRVDAPAGDQAAEAVPWTSERTFGVRLQAPGVASVRIEQVTPAETVWPIPR